MSEPEQTPKPKRDEKADDLPKLTAEEWAYVKAVTEARTEDAD